MISYPAMLDVPRALIQKVTTLLRAERRARIPTGSRALTCWKQAVLVLA